MNNKNGRKPIKHLLHHPDWSAASPVGTPRITLCWVDYKIRKQTIQNTNTWNTKYMNEIQKQTKHKLKNTKIQNKIHEWNAKYNQKIN